MSTKGQIKYKEKLEQIFGVLILVSGCYKLAKLVNPYCRLIYAYYRYMRIDKKKNKMKQFIENPKKKQEVHLEINFKAYRTTFRHHFNYYNQTNNNPSLSNTFQFYQPCQNFEAFTLENDKKYRLFCKPRFNDKMVMTSSLIKNMKSLERVNEKKSFNAFAYGQIYYSATNKHLQFLISSLSFSKIQTDKIWSDLITTRHQYRFFFYSALIGIGFSIVSNNKQNYLAKYQKIRQYFNQKANQ